MMFFRARLVACGRSVSAPTGLARVRPCLHPQLNRGTCRKVSGHECCCSAPGSSDVLGLTDGRAVWQASAMR